MKILLELDVEFSESGTDPEHRYTTVKLNHPDLTGHLYLRSTSKKLADLQLASLDKAPVTNTDPLTVILDSANKLAAGIVDFKHLVKKE